MLLELEAEAVDTVDDVDDLAARSEPLARKPSALTGGALKTPTPLPSVTNDTWVSLPAWGTSGAPLRPWTQPYNIPGI